MEATEHLPPFSGHCPACVKCGLPKGKAVGGAFRYIKDGDMECMERRCGRCGYSWRERCADEDWLQCVQCGGCAYPPLFEESPKCEECKREEFYMRSHTLDAS